MSTSIKKIAVGRGIRSIATGNDAAPHHLYKPGEPGQPAGADHLLTVPAIPTTDIVAKYTSRWEIELRIREIKTIMAMNFACSKTRDGVYKQMAAVLIAYNLTRELITESVHCDFPHCEYLSRILNGA